LQTSESDWQFLVRYSETLGYKVTCHGTHIHIFDPHRARDRSTSLHTLITGRAVADARPMPGTVIKFEGEFARRQADGEYMDTVVPVTYPDGTTFDVRTSEVMKLSSPARFENRLTEDVGSYAEALRLVRAAGRDVYDYTAEANVVGMVGCVPGGMVKLNEYNAQFDGWWYVNEVTHKANTSAFTTELCLARNAASELEQSSGVARFQTPPPPAAINNEFRASRTYYNVY
jgi:phage protein D